MNAELQKEIKTITAYELVRKEKLPDIKAEGFLLRHKKSGARVMLIPCEDDNKVFNIAFRTPPTDSTGVAHIIEHTVLCGSRKFPLKDPFVELAKGSLNTFLNAMTYPDKTMYPVASTNDTDFHNLVDVYLDAVFYPNIYREENIFRQEGFSRRIEKASDPIQYNGVVYNEMKGVFSSPDEVLGRQTMNALFPDTPYGVESGGDPDVIPTLTYDQFLDFHRKYYHPSNSYIYLYGDMNMCRYLKWMDKEYLSCFDFLPVNSAIAYQKPFRKMKTQVGKYPISDEESLDDNTYLSFNAVTANPLDMKESIAFDVLDYALFSSPGAPVKKALSDCGIGNDIFGSNTDGILQPYYSIIAKGANLKDEKRFLSVIRKELKKQSEDGINRKSLMAGINSLEFSYREGDYSTFPKGLIYGIDTFDTWLYNDEHPFDSFHQLKAYRELRKEAAKPTVSGEKGYFETLIEEKFLNNPFSAVVSIEPEKGLAQAREEKRTKQLSDYKDSLSKKEIEQLVKETKALEAFQTKEETKEALATLPVLRRKDIRKTVRPLSNIIRTTDGVKTVYHKYQTNGIGYVTLLFDAGCIPEELLPYLGFLKSVIGFVDTRRYTYQELYNEIGRNTGGITAGLSVYDDPDDPDGCRPYFGFKMKVLYPKMNTGFRLIKEMITTSSYSDPKRIREILMETISQLQVVMQQAGHAAASLRASAYYAQDSVFQDQTGGIAFYKAMKKLSEEYETQADDIADKLQKLCGLLFAKDKMIVSYTAESEGFDKLKAALSGFLTCLPEHAVAGEKCVIRPYGNLKEAFITAGQVQFVAETGNFKKSGHQYSGVLQVLRQMLNYDYLWQNIRVKGGAYGCGATFRREGDVAFRTFRDPHLLHTVEVFENLPEVMETYQADEDVMTKFVIGTISSTDIPYTPTLFDMISMQAFMNGLEKKDLQKSRDEILTVTDADIRNLAPLVRDVLKERNLCVIGSEAAIKKNKSLFKHIENLL